MITVYVATNRQPIPKTRPKRFGKDFSSDGLAALRFARAETTDAFKYRGVKVAEEHLTADTKQLKLGSKEIFEEVRREMTATSNDTIAFVHGFNVSFQEAVISAARLQKCLAASTGDANMVLFSWPSDGQAMPFASYWNDRQDAEASGRAFARGFLKLAEFLGGATPEEECDQRLHLVAHSMGSYVLRHALQELRKNPITVRKRPRAAEKKGEVVPTKEVTLLLPRIFDEIFLMAADEDDDAFEHDHKLRLLPKIGRRVNVYFNRGDIAMGISDITKANPDRLGADGPHNPRLVPGKVSLVDCSDVVSGLVGHSYYLDEPIVVEDMNRVLSGVEPMDNMLRAYDPERRIWRLQAA